MVYDPHSTTSGSVSDYVSAYGLDDVPPSYDSVTGEDGSSEYNQPPPGGSGSGSGLGGFNAGGPSGSSSAPPGPSGRFGAGPSSDAPWPASMNALFAPPRRAEVLANRDALGAPVPTKKSLFGGMESWDASLADPAVLYEYLRAETLNPPVVKIRCYASHTETVQVSTSTVENGHVRHLSKGQTHHVTDFDFTIDLTPLYNHAHNFNNVHLQATRAHVPAYRGTHCKTFGAATPGIAGRPATCAEVRVWDEWGKFSAARARAPWATMDGDDDFWLCYNGATSRGIRLGRSAPSGADEEALIAGADEERRDTSLREWCEAYCADRGLLKSFVLRKSVWGWDMAMLRKAIENAILSTGYQPSGHGIQITVSSPEATLTVRPDNWLVKATCSPFWFIVLCVTFIYPWIWLWQRRSPRGGAPYDVAAVTYAMKFYPPLPGTFPNESVAQARHRLPAMFKLSPEVPKNPTLQRGPKGVHYLLGRREGEWFRTWEEAIRMGARMNYQGELQMYRVDEDEDPPQLDGY